MSSVKIRSEITNDLDEMTVFEGKGNYDKEHNRITYYEKNVYVTIFIGDNTIKIEREEPEYNLCLIFKEHEKTNTSYFVKNMKMKMSLEIETTRLMIDKRKIDVTYNLHLNDQDMGIFEYKFNFKEENMNMKDTLKYLIEKSLLKMDIHNINIDIDTPKDKNNGDYATNIAMQLVKQLKQHPVDIASTIIANIEKNDIIDKADIAGPGFINFYIKKNKLFDLVTNVIKEDINYGKSDIGANKRVNVEFVSANPTGILHLGTARGASYGDNLCRILDYAGFDVTREYYINDAGNQINNLGLSIKARYDSICGLELNMPKDGYFGKEIIDIAQDIYDEYKDTKVNEKVELFKNIGVKKLLDRIEEDLKLFRVTFDIWSSETTVRQSGKVEESIDILKKMGNIYEQDNATWLRTTKYGDDKDRVIIKSNGDYTYVVPDIAYHLDKISRGYDILIDILGADHHGYVSRLRASIEALGHPKEKIDIKLLQMVKLIRDGIEVKMSKRTGDTVTIRELLDEVGVDAARYFFAMRSPDTQMDFDISLAVKKSNENPVYYVQYAHARICSILRELKEETLVNKFETIDSEYAYNILVKLDAFKEVVEASAISRMPHLITNYVYELASLFHTFYAHEKILTEDAKYTDERVCLIKAVKITIRNALNLIGVEALEKM